jgi:protein O-GlcNAc transferase
MAQLTIQQALDLAVQHHKSGRLREAEILYRQILTQQPGHYSAMHLLGSIAYRTGRYDVAIELIRGAIALNPNFPEAFNNLGNALKEKGQLDEAIAAYRQAITLNPGFPEANINLGMALKDKGQFEEAAAACRRAIALNPNLPEAHNILGNALRQTGQLDESIASYRKAIALRPGYAEAHSNLGGALRFKGQLDEAIAACRKAIALKPDNAEAHSNLGNVLKDVGQLDEAIAAYRQALVLSPGLAEVHSNLGIALKDNGQPDEAIAALRQAISLRPNFADAFNNLGNALQDKGELADAIAAYRRAVALRPGYAEAHSNLVFALHYYAGCDARAIAEELGNWNRQYGEPLRASIQKHFNDHTPDRRLRIGYVSADFRFHASAYFLSPLFKHHDRQQVELFCYAQVVRPDAMTAQLQQFAHGWRSIVGMSDDEVASQVREDQIDILVDLKLHTAENRLLVFARKPAPVQVAWLGYPGSTGLCAIDYRLSDPHLDPPGMDESIYSEQTIRLPDAFWCYDPLDSRGIPVNDLPAQSSGIITFGCLNNFSKVNDDVLTLWAKVMRQIKNSRLLLLSPLGDCRLHTQQRLQQEGIEPGRVEFVGFQSRQKYLETYHRIDLELDTFPYNGHTTSLDSLWMGVPLVTLVGSRAVARAGWCLLSNLGLAELAGQTPEEFVRIAVDLANDLPRLQQLRSTLRRRMEQSPLMDGPKFAQNVEAAYRRMWHTWCATASSGR